MDIMRSACISPRIGSFFREVHIMDIWENRLCSSNFYSLTPPVALFDRLLSELSPP
jgi:hypothetical protein